MSAINDVCVLKIWLAFSWVSRSDGRSCLLHSALKKKKIVCTVRALDDSITLYVQEYTYSEHTVWLFFLSTLRRRGNRQTTVVCAGGLARALSSGRRRRQLLRHTNKVRYEWIISRYTTRCWFQRREVAVADECVLLGIFFFVVSLRTLLQSERNEVVTRQCV